MDRRAQIEAAIAAQEELRETLGDEIVDATIAALRSSIAETEAAEPRRKLITVLFADIAGFTGWSEPSDPEDVGASIEKVWSRLDQLITRYGGTIDKHIGDAVMAIWGMGVAREDDPENAIRAALAMQEEFREMTAAGQLGQAELGLRIGINTGPVILRAIGTAGEYTALGDSVNVASRLEAAAPIGHVLVGHDTYRHVRGVFTVTERPALLVKGKQAPLRTYVVTGVQPRAFRVETRGIEGIETRMVGRETELAALQELTGAAIETGSARLVTVVGEAGFGKSRLLYEFLDWVQLQRQEVLVLTARSDAQQESTPYALIKDLVFSRFEIKEDEPISEAVAKLETGFGDYGSFGPAPVHRAAHLIGLDMGDSPHVAGIMGDPQQLRDRGEEAIVDLVIAMAERSPVVMLLEDLHWADTASLDLVEQVLGGPPAPVLTVAAARPTLFERRPHWGSGGVRLQLDELSPQATEELIAEVMQRAVEVPADVRRAIVDAAGGNPFYVEELISSMIEEGTIRVVGPEWEIDPPNAKVPRTPPTLTALLQARLDRLPPHERSTLQRASVVGRVFWDESLPLSGEIRSRLEAALQALRSRELVLRHHRSVFHGSQEFSFRHAILRDVTYESVLKSDRRIYHRAVAEWLASKPDSESRAAVVAGHFEAAGSLQAGEWYVRAGTQARLRFANDEALAAYSHALQLGSLDDEAAYEAYDGMGEVLMLSARYPEAVEAHRQMLTLAQGSGDLRSQARALTGILFAEARIGSTAAAMAVAEEAITTVLAMEVPDQKLLAEALRGAGWMALRSGETRAAKKRAQQAVAAAEAAGDRRGVSLSLNLLSLAESTLGNYRAAEAHVETALQIDRELGDRRSEATSLINLGEGARRRGDYKASAARFLESLEIQRELGDRDNEALALSNLGGALVGQGRFAEALESLKPAREAAETAGRLEHLSETRRFLAEAYLGLGDDATALACAVGALVDGREAGNAEQIGHAWRVLGLIAAQRGRPVVVAEDDSSALTADECFARAVAGLAEEDIDRAVTLASWARATRSTDGPRAERLLEEAMGILRPVGLEYLADDPA